MNRHQSGSARRHRCAVLGVLAVLVLAAVATAAPSKRNAAYWLDEAFARYHTLSESEWNTVIDYAGAAVAPPPEHVRAMLSKAAPILRDLRRAARCDYCDFELNYEDGFEMLLPHLAPARRGARLMYADAMAKLAAGDSAGAARGLADLTRLGGLFRDDQILISSLVARAIDGLAERGAKIGVARRAFSAADAAVLDRALAPLNPRDPFAFGPAIATEREMIRTWLPEKFEDGASMADIMMWTDDDAAFQRIDDLSAAELDREFTIADEYMTRAADILAIDDESAAKAAARALDKDIEGLRDGMEEGLLIALTMPAYGRMVDLKFDAIRSIEARRAQLADIMQHGPDVFRPDNAAAYYLQAIARLDGAGDDVHAALFALAGDPASPPDELAVRTTESVRTDVRTLMEAGAALSECDFSIVAVDSSPIVIHAHQAGMMHAARTLIADAVIAFHRDDLAGMAGRLTTALQAAAHLAGDGMVTSSLVAHAVYRDVDACLAAVAFDPETIDPLTRTAFFRAANAIEREDVFRYNAALDVLRRTVSYRIAPSDAKPTMFGRAAHHRSIMALDPDEIVAVALLLHADPEQQIGGTPAAHLAWLTGVLDIEALQARLTRAAEQRAALDGKVRATMTLPDPAPKPDPVNPPTIEDLDPPRVDYAGTVDADGLSIATRRAAAARDLQTLVRRLRGPDDVRESRQSAAPPAR